jgi:hypothetical protein
VTAETAPLSTPGDVSKAASGSGTSRESSEPSQEPSVADSQSTLPVSRETKTNSAGNSKKSDGNLIGKNTQLDDNQFKKNIASGRDFLMIGASQLPLFRES